MTEYELMMMCMSYCKRNDIYVIHIDNESGTASRRALGMRRGVPDLMLVTSEAVMFIELKRDESLQPSDSQKMMIANICKHQIHAVCCGSYASFIRAVTAHNISSLNRVGELLRLNNHGGKSDMLRVSKFYLDSINVNDSPYNLFAIKFETSADLKFPWLIDLMSKTFVATRESKVTKRLLSIGWDVILI